MKAYAMNPILQALEQDITSTVRALGGELYRVGGVVRDKLLGFVHEDTDLLATGVDFETLKDALARTSRVNVVGASFGVIKVSRQGVGIDLALPRTERSTGVGHREFEVAYDPHLSIEQDLSRRDFTVNAMAEKLSDGALVDPFGGRRDIEQKLLRAVGDPKERFAEDPLRMLRAGRFMAKLDFSLDASTFVAAKELAHLIATVAPERISYELQALLGASSPTGVYNALVFLRDSSLLTEIIPEWTSSIGFDQQNKHHQLALDQHVFQAIAYAVNKGADVAVRLALLFHDIAKPMTQTFGDDGSAHYYQHEVLGAEITENVMERLKFSGEMTRTVVRLVRNHMRPPMNPSNKTLRRWLNQMQQQWPLALACREADFAAKSRTNAGKASAWADQLRLRCQAFSREVATLKEQSLALSGQEIMRVFGLKPGPQVGKLKRLALQAVVDGELENQQESILRWLKERKEVK